ncbi:hypothetical protein [Marinoscillum pacificum]|uniref:hypothetical protein n=1 Tax=Marinoscillum pacificum TaxID=392723 RepID=UPI002157913B|nr:hypothetical protein [Marinoscillum pacificum]
MADNKWKDIAVSLAVVAGMIILWLALDRKKLIATVDNLEKVIEENDLITKEIKSRLKELVQSDDHLDEDTQAELMSISGLIEIKEETKALSALAKIIENLLKKLYKQDQSFKDFLKKNNRKGVFHDYLEFARIKGVISTEDYHLVSVLKIYRNEEAHELNVQKDTNKIVTAFITGISMMIVLSKKLKAITQKIDNKFDASAEDQYSGNPKADT